MAKVISKSDKVSVCSKKGGLSQCSLVSYGVVFVFEGKRKEPRKF